MRAVDSVTNETTTVKAVDGVLQVQIVGGGGDTVTWDSIEDKPVSFPTAAAEISDAGATGVVVLKAAGLIASS